MTYAKMPLKDSPWESKQSPQDVEDYIAYFEGLGEKVSQLLGSADSRTADSFMTGGQQGMERYHRATRAFQKTKTSSFRFADMKRMGKPLSVFIIADAARIKSQKNVISLIQWCALQELKRHPNTHVPVHIIADEGTNFRIDGLSDLITWSRGYGVRLKIVIQDIAAFRRTYGKDALDTLLSETEIKLFLPGQRNPETLSLLERMLGPEAVMMRSQSGTSQPSNHWASGWNLGEDGKPLLYANEIREMKQGILFIRQNKPALVDVPPIAAIEPLRDQIDINPFHGKPFLLPISVWLGKNGRFSIRALWRKFKRLFRNTDETLARKKARLERYAMACRTLSTLVGLWWLAGLVWLYAYTNLPQVLWYEFNRI